MQQNSFCGPNRILISARKVFINLYFCVNKSFVELKNFDYTNTNKNFLFSYNNTVFFSR